MLEQVHDAEFRIVGDGPELERLRTIAESLGILDRVTFLGKCDGNDVVSELQQCRVFGNPSRHTGGYETTQIEAMACGRIVVTPDAGSNSMLISPGVTGFMFRMGSARSLAKALVKALVGVRADERERMSAAARAKAISDFDVRRMGEMAEACFISTCGLGDN